MGVVLTYILDNVGDDCPVFDGLFDYCAISAGGSMGTSAFKCPGRSVDLTANQRGLLD